MIMNKEFPLTKKQIALFASALALNLMVFYGARLINGDMEHHDLSIALDHQVPLMPWTVFIYLGAFLFWIVNYCICIKYDKYNGRSFIIAHYIGEAVCFICFLVLPTALPRPEITGHTFADFAMRVTYMCDQPNNLFPSIHCMVSWFCWIGVRGNEHVPKWYQYFSLIFAIAICISTVTVKQHVIVDTFSGVLLAEVSYLISRQIDKRLPVTADRA